MERHAHARPRQAAHFEALESRTLLDAAPVGAGEPRTIDFAGVQWIVKAGDDPVEPGPNAFSDSEQSVWVDTDGLHLKLRFEDGTWYSAEVYTAQPTTYGMHRFYLDGRPDLLDPNVVLGLSLAAENGEGMDIEFSRWSQGDPGFNSQYAVRPAQTPGNLVRFTTGLNGPLSTHYLDWQPDVVTFKSFHGHGQQPPNEGHLIQQWQRSGEGIPTDDDLYVHINLWSNDALPPTDLQEAEIVIAAADLPNLLPTIGSLAVDAEWLIRGEALTLSAVAADDVDGRVTRVEFYRDDNADGVPQAAEKLGEDLDGTDGWSWSGPADWEAGTYTYLARATDDDGAVSTVAAGGGTIAEPVDFTVVIGTGADADGRSVRFVEPDGTKCSVRLVGGTATLGFRRQIPAVGDGGGDEVVIETGGVRLVDIALAGTTGASLLKLTASGGSDRGMEVRRITSETALGKLLAARTDLAGGGLFLTDGAFVKDLRLHGLTEGADVVLSDSAGGQGTTIRAVTVGTGSVIDLRQGRLKKATVTGEFRGVLTAGVERGDDGRWFTDDDTVARVVSVGTVRLGRQRGVSDDPGDPWGLLLGPETRQVKTGLPDEANTGVCVDSTGFEAWVLGETAPTVAIQAVRGPAAKRSVTGQVTGVAGEFYKVVLYVRTDHWYIQPEPGSALEISRNGRWKATKVQPGEVYAWLVRADADLGNELWSPLTVDGVTVLAEDLFAG